MDNFISIIWKDGILDERTIAESIVNLANVPLTEDEFDCVLGESEDGENVWRIAISEALGDEESHKLAEAIAEKLFDSGLVNFDIEISAKE
jgi:hypothetical protein